MLTMKREKRRSVSDHNNILTMKREKYECDHDYILTMKKEKRREEKRSGSVIMPSY